MAPTGLLLPAGNLPCNSPLQDGASGLVQRSIRSASPTPQTSERSPSADTHSKVETVADLLGGSRTIAFQSALAHCAGGALAGLLLSQLWYWSGTRCARERGGWFYKTQEELFDETGMTRREQESARKKLVKLGILEEKFEGLPRKRFFRINQTRLYECLAGYTLRLPAQEQERMERRRQAKIKHQEWRERSRQPGEPETLPADPPPHTVQNRHSIMADSAIIAGTKPPLFNGGKRQTTTEMTAESTAPENSSSRAEGPPAPANPSLDTEAPAAAFVETEILVADLAKAGLNRADARRLAGAHAEECRRQLQYLPFKIGLDNPGAYLRTAIEGHFSPPKAFLQVKEREDRARKRQEETKAVQAREALSAAQKREEEARVDASLESLKTEAPETFGLFQNFVQQRRSKDEAKFQQVPPAMRSKMLARLYSNEVVRTLFLEWRAMPCAPKDGP